MTTTYEYDEYDVRTPEQRAAYEAADAALSAAWLAFENKCKAAAKKFSPDNADYITLLNVFNTLYEVSEDSRTEAEMKIWLGILDKAMKKRLLGENA